MKCTNINNLIIKMNERNYSGEVLIKKLFQLRLHFIKIKNKTLNIKGLYIIG